VPHAKGIILVRSLLKEQYVGRISWVEFSRSITASAALPRGFLNIEPVKLQQQVINRAQLDFRQVTRVEQAMDAPSPVPGW
jgi:hypothetical protein